LSWLASRQPRFPPCGQRDSGNSRNTGRMQNTHDSSSAPSRPPGAARLREQMRLS